MPKVPQVELAKAGIQIYQHAMNDSIQMKEDKDDGVFSPEELEAEHLKWQTFVLNTSDEQMTGKSSVDREAWKGFRQALEVAIQKQYAVFCELNALQRDLAQLKGQATGKEEAELRQKIEIAKKKGELLTREILNIFNSKPMPERQKCSLM